jgi:hypothetical protein
MDGDDVNVAFKDVVDQVPVLACGFYADGAIVCPICGYVKKKGASFCRRCGVLFVEKACVDDGAPIAPPLDATPPVSAEMVAEHDVDTTRQAIVTPSDCHAKRWDSEQQHCE